MDIRDAMVFIVDDDLSIQDTLCKLLETEGLATRAFGSATEFLGFFDPVMRGCLLLDVCLPEMTGLDLQRKLGESGVNIPIIFLTGYGDVPMSSMAFRNGAMDFIEKPFQIDDLLERVKEALLRDQGLWQKRVRRIELNERHTLLTERERAILRFVVAGYSSKEVGKALDISNRTVEVHRAHIMQKMQAVSLADLIGMALDLEANQNQ